MKASTSPVSRQLVADWQRTELEAGEGRRPSLPTDEDLYAFLRRMRWGVDAHGHVIDTSDGRVGVVDRHRVRLAWDVWRRMHAPVAAPQLELAWSRP